MNKKILKNGNITISYHAIATIAYQSALESYGVVGLANENFAKSLSRFFSKNLQSGVVINYENGSLLIDLFIIVEYGTRISSVAKSVAHSVKFNVEKLINVPVHKVNVHVRGLRVSNTD
ncbi:MAG: Asp23/Gls24 family envelope stress response protein [Anaerolineaceae bacterium]|nr:Asp23/Gls24 family envelope stress response protein [Anaerolineaceae bacterium]